MASHPLNAVNNTHLEELAVLQMLALSSVVITRLFLLSLIHVLAWSVLDKKLNEIQFLDFLYFAFIELRKMLLK